MVRDKKTTDQLSEENAKLLHIYGKISEDEKKFLERLIMLDPLLGIYNRRKFVHDIAAHSRRAKSGVNYDDLSLIMLDIDHFRNFNEEYGHLAGDFVLKSIGGLLNKMIRPEDGAYRYGGEELAILLPNTHIEPATEIAERIRHGFNEAVFNFKIRGEMTPLKVTASLGVAAYRKHNCYNSEDLIRRSDNALYFSKKMGRNRVSLYDK